MNEDMAALYEWAQRTWDAIRDVAARVIKAVARLYRDLRAAHLIPRQYRDTMARRKIRRYMMRT